MLAELQIINFAIIDKLNISFENGLTVFTGETGAGKSMIIDAIALLAGARGSSEYVRHGAKKAEIEALLEIEDPERLAPLIRQTGMDISEDQIILRREIAASGKSVCRINGKLVTLSILQQFGELLIDIHGQHEHQRLLNQANHIRFVDQYGSALIASLKSKYKKTYDHVAEVVSEYRRYSRDEKEIAQRIDLLKYQIQEIGAAQLSVNEEQLLNEEKSKLVHYEKIFSALKSSYQALNGEHAVLDMLRTVSGGLDSVSDLDPQLENVSESVANSFYLLEEQTSTIRNYMEQMEYDPKRLDEIEERLSDIQLLKRKYGSTIKEILNYWVHAKKELEELSARDANMETLSKALAEGLADLREKGMQLKDARKETGKQLVKAINREFKDLCMADARMEIHVDLSNDLGSFTGFTSEGIDCVTFYIATNPGEPAKPLAKIASGGELSRIMLAIKSVFKKMMGGATIIFDEVDTGVSGQAAQAMAEKISRLSQNAQVFCITHLPQVAAMADHHMFIEKHMMKGHRTGTSIKLLTEPEKIREISRMISGSQMTDLAREHARELIRMAEQVKQ
ncbi:DNA repair protein RecN [Sporolactobacillus sp. CPB3-1]|uniref:DNA repair protein RecN n=1 Tax=Sporolactobacillus mangiferae TaxID=2940498 RepID=A0ABT0MDC2_9BACL|nr:DNA repair protein RecN [Sporolactobacillus mangiferae]MCL1632578.1 DNA repair protein RecN [Sporolactobacillus mangiferae]